MTPTVDAALTIARAELGYVEQGGSNGRSGNLTKFGKWFGLDGQPWCAMFDSFVLAQIGLPLAGAQTSKGFASCELGMEWFQRMGLFIPRAKAKDWRPGDLPFYDEGLIEGHGATRHAGHTGILTTAVHGSTVTDIEGNTSPTNRGSQRNGGCVAEKDRPVAWIIGVGRPQYSPTSAPTPQPGPSAKWPGRYLSLSSPPVRGADVKLLQQKMKNWGTKLTVDGVFGRATYDAVRWWQTAFGLAVDGTVGPVTWAEFFRR